MSTEFQRGVRLGVWCKVIREFYRIGPIGIGHPELVVSGHCSDCCIRNLINVESVWSAAVGIDVNLVSRSGSELQRVEGCNIGVGTCSRRSDILCDKILITLYKGDVDCRNLVLLVETDFGVRIGIRVRITGVVSLAPGGEHLD